MNEVRDFEAKIKRIEEIVSLLEKGGIPLAESMLLYEEGIATVGSCMDILKSAKLKIEKVGKGGGMQEFTDNTAEKS